MLLPFLQESIKDKKKRLAVLIDPDKCSESHLNTLIDGCNSGHVDVILVGGSLVTCSVDETVSSIKSKTDIPLFLFPGSSNQLSNKADGILFISLISGRNPDFLIGQQVRSAMFLKANKLEVVPTGYILVEGGKTTAVEHISQTRPIPADNKNLAKATAVAGELLGMKMIYLEAGSGALSPIPSEMISEVKEAIDIPLIVGGGMRCKEHALSALQAGADMLVIGNFFESSPELVEEYAILVHAFSM